MISNEALAQHPHPLHRAFQLQKYIAELKAEVAGAEVEFSQIVLHCREKNLLEDGYYHLKVSSSTRHTVNPVKFAENFPEANDHLMQLFITAMQSDLKTIQEKKILPEITVENALREVGKDLLYKMACDAKVSEKATVVVGPAK